MTRRAFRRAAYRAVAHRALSLSILAAAALVLDPVTTAHEARGERGPTAHRDTDLSAASTPRIVAATMVGGPVHAYARQVASADSPMRLEPSEFRTIEEAWSRAFFGDRQRMAEFIDHSAVINGLPVGFLSKLLHQESGLNHQAVSRAGALGVAQFMPATASERGLADPFNPFEAIPKSAELLKEYRARFGNLGFAAAAYNAGPQRVRDWISGRGSLPKETRDYVAKITGRSVEDWRQSGDLNDSMDRWAPLTAQAIFAGPLPSR
ncbi:lytic transglycosylase domain-containing protein [Methylobacterium planeticum]|uniref:lytic transglycosylase domain-containing protein n=1 Tax=Methylobacterium planeticum TaxID=2615211 RepID=UPI001FF024D7|nr:lytic transglycosylase domain-containing protein [Methylobacterium planeticum]